MKELVVLSFFMDASNNFLAPFVTHSCYRYKKGDNNLPQFS